MANEIIKVTIDAEKLAAIRKYSPADRPTIEEELTAYADKIFQKRVPALVRDFIESRAEYVTASKEKGRGKG